MAKELKSFDRIKNYQVIVDIEKDETSTIKELLPNSCEIIETELKELSEYKKVFEKLNLDISDATDLENWIKLAQFHYENKNKKTKAFEIIKEKRVNVFDLFLYGQNRNYDEMMSFKEAYFEETHKVITISQIPLTQEEYDLLKEMLK